MPLLDHFQPPLSRSHPWRAFHGAWAAAMARLLNAGVLPDGYYAVPFLDRDSPSEIDIAALPATLTWSSSAHSMALAVEWPAADDIMIDDGDPRLAAAIELVSPRNKDRPRARDVRSQVRGLSATWLWTGRRGCGDDPALRPGASTC